MGRLFVGLIVAAGLAALAYAAGPRVRIDTAIDFDPSALGEDPEAWLAERESRFTDIRPGLEKEIVWAFPQSRARTPIAIVYVHGFSASKGEIRPVPDRVAEALGANLFYTRLAGHGRDGEAMAEASAKDWLNDYAEAVAVGRAIGERVIVMATSTGAALATWGATRPELSEGVAGLVLVSPNYGVQAPGSGILTRRWGLHLAEALIGRERSFEPRNEAHASLWTTRYPTSAVLPMAAVSELARQAPVEDAAMPALFVYSDADTVVRPELTREIAARWGAPSENFVIEGADDPNHHVIAGDALSPSTTTLAAGRIEQWIRSVSP